MDTNKNNEEQPKRDPFYQFLARLFDYLEKGNQELPEDLESKTIGDRVKLLDDDCLHYFVDVETREQLSSERQIIPANIRKLYMSEPMMVVKTGLSEQEGTYKCGHCDMEHSHDIIVHVPSIGRDYYCTERWVKIV